MNSKTKSDKKFEQFLDKELGLNDKAEESKNELKEADSDDAYSCSFDNSSIKESLQNIVSGNRTQKNSKIKALSTGSNSGLQGEKKKIPRIKEFGEDIVLEDFDEEVTTPMNAYMINEEQKAKSTVKQKAKQKAKIEALE